MKKIIYYSNCRYVEVSSSTSHIDVSYFLIKKEKGFYYRKIGPSQIYPVGNSMHYAWDESTETNYARKNGPSRVVKNTKTNTYINHWIFLGKSIIEDEYWNK